MVYIKLLQKVDLDLKEAVNNLAEATVSIIENITKGFQKKFKKA